MSEAFENITLAKDGQTQYKIYIGETKNPTVLYAAEELSSYLHQITDAKFTITNTFISRPELRYLFIGSNEVTDKLCPEILDTDLGENGFVYRTNGSNVVITGAAACGSLYGVYYFLDQVLGVRWFSPDFTHIPKIKNLQVKFDDLNQVQVPHFIYREIHAKDGDDPSYRHHNLLNGKKALGRDIPVEPALDIWSNYFGNKHHSFYHAVPKEDYGQTHPEYFAGKQLAVMNKEVRRIAAKHYIQRIEKMIENGERYEDTYFGLSQMDGGWRPWNRDEKSKEFAEKHGGAMSAPILDFVKDVANQVREVYPEAKFSTLVYQFSFTPPVGMNVPDYIQITAGPLHTNVGKSLLDQNNRMGIAEDLKRWAEISNHILVWDYIVKFNTYFIQPTPNISAMARTIKGLAKHPSFKGYYAQGSNHMTGWPFAELRTWIGSRLLWNPNLDAKKLIDEFLTGYYGAAAPFIKQYIHLMENAFDSTDSLIRGGSDITEPYLAFDVMQQADEIFDQAEAAVAERPEFLQHVQSERIEVDYTILLRRQNIDKRMWSNYESDHGLAWQTATEQRLTRFKAYMELAGVTQLSKGKKNYSMEQLYAAMNPPVPECVEKKEPWEWLDYPALFFILPNGRNLVQDSLASDGVAAQLPGDLESEGLQLDLSKLPSEGEYQFYVYARVVRLHAAVEKDDAFAIGFFPGVDSRVIKVEDTEEGTYQAFECPGTYQKGDQTLKIVPLNLDTVEVYIDRVIATMK